MNDGARQRREPRRRPGAEPRREQPNPSARGRRTSLRLRLTIIGSGLFFLTGALLIGLTYLVVRHALIDQFHAFNANELLGPKPLPPSKPLLIEDDGTVLTVADIKAQITADQRRMLDSTLRTLLMISLVATAGVGALSAGLGWIVAGRLIRPLQTITGTARGVAGGSLHSRIRMSGPADELKELADTFDAMLERLDRAFDGQRRFVANASHELRTPLAVTRTLIQVAMGRADAPPGLRELGGKLLEVNDRQVRMTDALLTLARTEDALTDVEPVDLARVAAHSARALAEDARTAAVRMRTELASARTTGDPVLLDQLVGNLLRNAVQHNVGGGWVLAQTGADATTCWITVTNTGAELSAGDADEIFEPFRRLSGRAGRTDHTGGVGLGLSIVRSITHAHGGRVEARPRDGGGLTVRVELPVAG